MVGLGGSKKENPNSAIFQDQERSFNYIVVALQFVTCDKNKRENERRQKKRKKKHKNEIKGTIGRTNPFSFLVIQFPPPIDDPLILLLPLLF
jgi:hypothetical protein